MRTQHRGILVLCALACSFQLTRGQPGAPNEVDLQRYLQNITNSRYARPEKFTINVTNVDIRFFPAQVIDMDGNMQTMVISGLLYMHWNDRRLRWNLSDYGEARFTRLPAGKVWVPSLDVFNSAADPTSIQAHPTKDQVSVYEDGKVLFARKLRLTTACTFDITKFPGDAQSCDIQLAIMGYAETEVNLRTNMQYESMSFYSESNEWRIDDTKGVGWKSEIQKKTFSPLTSRSLKIPVFVYQMDLIRERGYYDVMMIAPLIFISILMVLVFFLPVESGEKIGLAITVLLAFTIFLLLMDSATPKSKNLPYLSIYITSLMGLSTMSIYVSAYVLNTYHKDPSKKMSPCFRFFVFEFLARVVCFRQCDGGGEAITRTEENSAASSKVSLKLEIETVAGSETGDNLTNAEMKKVVIIEHVESDKPRDGDGDIEYTNIQLSGGDDATLWQAAALILDKGMLLVGLFILLILMVVFLSVLIYHV